MSSYFLLGWVVLITHFLEGITGFGCTVLALPFAILLVGTKQAVPVLLFLALLLAAYIVAIDWKRIVWREFLKIVCFVGLGLPVGIFAFGHLNETARRYILGVFMIAVAARGLLSYVVRLNENRLPGWALNGLLVAGGFIHGVFSSGGPLVVIYAKKVLPDKSNFRATISMLWLSLNSVMLAQNVVSGRMTARIWEIIAVCLPFLLGGALAGNWAHRHIQDKYFSQLVYGVLLVSGGFMFS